MTYGNNVLMRTEIRRYLLWISYDGSRFPEMAYGGTGFGVMNMLHQVISDSLFGIRPEIQPEYSNLRFSPSSRTDANVHALRNAVICQVPLIKSDLDASNSKKNNYLSHWNRHIDTIAPGSMKILDVHRVSPGFCVRRNISYRRYTYRLAVARNWEIWDSIQESPSTVCFSEKNYAWCLPPGFQPEKAAKACNIFKGEKIMGSFYKHSAREKRREVKPVSTVKNLLLIEITRGEPYNIENNVYDYYNISVVAKSFVREQIRRMMSCIILHGYDRLPIETIQWLIKNPISSNFHDLRIPVAPPQGLFLTDVVYAPEMFTNPIPYHKHSWDYDITTSELTESE